MTNQFVNDVWFRSVLWVAVVSDVLGRMENLEGKTIQELSLSQETTDRLKSPSSLRLKEGTDVLQLGDIGVAESFNILLHFFNCKVGLLTCVFFEQGLQLLVAVLPDILFLIRVGNFRDFWVTNFVVKCNICNIVSSLFVLRISKTGMVNLLDTLALSKGSLPDEVEIFDSGWEPRNFWSTNFLDSFGNEFQLFYSLGVPWIVVGAVNIDEEINLTPF